MLENLRYFFFVLGETLPKIKNCVIQESVEFARVLRLSVEFKFLLHLFPSSLLGFRPLSVEFEWNVTHLSVEFKKTLHFFLSSFCALHVYLSSSREALHVFLSSFCALHVFLSSWKLRYMFFCRVEKCVTCFSVEFGKRYTFFCGVREALHVFLSSFDFSSKSFYKLLNSSTASKIFCTSKLFYCF